MAVSRFEQIRPVDLRPAMSAIPAAGTQFTAGFDALQNILGQQRGAINRQLGRERLANTEALQGTFDQFQNLADFNRALAAGDFSIGAVRRQFGDQVDVSGLPGMIESARERLRGVARDEATMQAMEAARQGRDTSLAAPAATQALIAAGVRPGAAPAIAADIGGSVSGAFGQRFAKQRAEDTLAAEAELRNQTYSTQQDLDRAITRIKGKYPGADERQLQTTMGSRRTARRADERQDRASQIREIKLKNAQEDRAAAQIQSASDRAWNSVSLEYQSRLGAARAAAANAPEYKFSPAAVDLSPKGVASDPAGVVSAFKSKYTLDRFPDGALSAMEDKLITEYGDKAGVVLAEALVGIEPSLNMFGEAENLNRLNQRITTIGNVIKNKKNLQAKANAIEMAMNEAHIRHNVDTAERKLTVAGGNNPELSRIINKEKTALKTIQQQRQKLANAVTRQQTLSGQGAQPVQGPQPLAPVAAPAAAVQQSSAQALQQASPAQLGAAALTGATLADKPGAQLRPFNLLMDLSRFVQGGPAVTPQQSRNALLRALAP